MTYVPVVVMSWIVILAYVILLSCFATDIIGNVCIPYGVYSSIAAEKTAAFSLIFIGYLLPLFLMIFCF